MSGNWPRRRVQAGDSVLATRPAGSRATGAAARAKVVILAANLVCWPPARRATGAIWC